jgi:hypothetical protein
MAKSFSKQHSVGYLPINENMPNAVGFIFFSNYLSSFTFNVLNH